jgi:hypothetical protein
LKRANRKRDEHFQTRDILVGGKAGLPRASG